MWVRESCRGGVVSSVVWCYRLKSSAWCGLHVLDHWPGCVLECGDDINVQRQNSCGMDLGFPVHLEFELGLA